MKYRYAWLVLFFLSNALQASFFDLFRSNNLDFATDHGVGIGGAWDVTAGFAYRRHFENRLGVQGIIGAFGYSRHFHAGVAGQGMYTLLHHEFSMGETHNLETRFYGLGLVSAKYIYHSHKVSKETHTFEPGLGLGVGFEITFGKHCSLAIDVPVHVAFSINQVGAKFEHAYPTIGGALIYYF